MNFPTADGATIFGKRHLTLVIEINTIEWMNEMLAIFIWPEIWNEINKPSKLATLYGWLIIMWNDQLY